MARQHLSDLVGKLLPRSFVGSYPRPTWFGYNLRGRDILQPFRDEDFAQAYRDGVRAMIGDREEAGPDVLADGHLWYDRHQGFIASFVLYNLERIQGIEISPTVELHNPLTEVADTPGMEALAEIVEAIFAADFTVTGRLRRGPMRHAFNWSLAQRRAARPVKAFFAAGPVEPSIFLTDRHHHDRKGLLRDPAEIYHAEMLDAVEAGARIAELDDLIYVAPRDERAFDVEILNRVFEGVGAYRIWHCCHGGTPGPIGLAPYRVLFP